MELTRVQDRSGRAKLEGLAPPDTDGQPGERPRSGRPGWLTGARWN